jgi:hypothetical protein
LSKKSRLHWPDITDFYFRRLKRIVPVYLAVIFFVQLISLAFVVFPVDFMEVFGEVWLPLVFYANHPADPHFDYFKEVSFRFYVLVLEVKLQRGLGFRLMGFLDEVFLLPVFQSKKISTNSDQANF